MSDRIEKLYDRWVTSEIEEDDVHLAIDGLLETAGIVQDVVNDPDNNVDDARIAILNTLADIAGIEPGFTGPWYIVRYDVTREYGGPEEGGWYFDWYENPKLVATFQDDWNAAQESRTRLEEIEKECRRGDGRPQGRFSVLGGVDHVHVIETEIGKATSTEAPRYE